jgi:uncharacterized membrane protein YfcA
VRHALGFGFSLLFVPTASLVLGFHAAVVTAVFLEILVSGMIVFEYWKHVRLLEAVVLKLAGFLGIALGAVALKLIPARTIIITSMIVLLAVAVALQFRAQLRMRERRSILMAAGIVSGALNVWSSLSGPPIVLYYIATQRSVESIRGILSGYFLLLYAGTAATYLLNGYIARYSHWGILIGLAVTVLILFVPSRWVAVRTSHRFTTFALYAIIGTSVYVIVREIFFLGRGPT